MDELKQAIREARSVIIILPDHSSDKDFLAALQIQKINPEKIHLIAPAEKEQNWSDTFDIKPVKKEFAITIDTALSPVEELRYEKGDSSLTIFLTHKHAFNQAALSFAEHLPRATFGLKMAREKKQSFHSRRSRLWDGSWCARVTILTSTCFGRSSPETTSRKLKQPPKIFPLLCEHL